MKQLRVFKTKVRTGIIEFFGTITYFSNFNIVSDWCLANLSTFSRQKQPATAQDGNLSGFISKIKPPQQF